MNIDDLKFIIIRRQEYFTHNDGICYDHICCSDKLENIKGTFFDAICIIAETLIQSTDFDPNSPPQYDEDGDEYEDDYTEFRKLLAIENPSIDFLKNFNVRVNEYELYCAYYAEGRDILAAALEYANERHLDFESEETEEDDEDDEYDEDDIEEIVKKAKQNPEDCEALLKLIDYLSDVASDAY